MDHMKTLLIISSVILLFHANEVSSRYVKSAAPVPGTPVPEVILTTTKRSSAQPLLLTSYIPVAMQLLTYCSEMIQYEPTVTTTKKPITQAPTTETITTAAVVTAEDIQIIETTTKPKPTTTTTTTTTTQRPATTITSTTTETTTMQVTTTPNPTTVHKPGYFGPSQPPPPVDNNNEQENNEEPPEQNNETTENLLWNDKQFFEWFLQNKYKQIKFDNDYNLQILDPLPQRLLQDIETERYELPTLLTEDNVNEFRRVYDDKYDRDRNNDNESRAGKKKIPPTKAYIHMLMLYDLLKREAKKLMFNKYEGYSNEILEELSQSNEESAQQQLRFVLSKLLERKDIEKADVVLRTQSMIKELTNPSSVIAMALRYVPPLSFLA